jgi:hypothetical protein
MNDSRSLIRNSARSASSRAILAWSNSMSMVNSPTLVRSQSIVRVPVVPRPRLQALPPALEEGVAPAAHISDPPPSRRPRVPRSPAAHRAEAAAPRRACGRRSCAAAAPEPRALRYPMPPRPRLRRFARRRPFFRIILCERRRGTHQRACGCLGLPGAAASGARGAHTSSPSREGSAVPRRRGEDRLREFLGAPGAGGRARAAPSLDCRRQTGSFERRRSLRRRGRHPAPR